MVHAGVRITPAGTVERCPCTGAKVNRVRCRLVRLGLLRRHTPSRCLDERVHQLARLILHALQFAMTLRAASEGDQYGLDAAAGCLPILLPAAVTGLLVHTAPQQLPHGEETMDQPVSRYGEKTRNLIPYRILGSLAALASIVAGVYLLTGQSAVQETTVFDAIMHGMGGYMVARGLWMFAEMASGR